MITGNFIESDIPALHMKDHVSTALNFFDDFKVVELPVIGPEGLLGLISEDVVLNAPHNFHIEDLQKSFSMLRIHKDQHLFNALRQFQESNLSLLPVVDEDEQFLGCVRAQELLKTCCQWLNVTEPGGLVHLEINSIDYSLAQISQIVESNDAKILSCMVLPHSNSKMIEVVVKTNKEELSAIIQTFERYQYKIMASYHKDLFKEGLDERFGSFIRYLNI